MDIELTRRSWWTRRRTLILVIAIFYIGMKGFIHKGETGSNRMKF